MALTCHPLHWAAALVLFGAQGGQLQVQMAGGPTDPLPLSSLGSPDGTQNGRPGRHPGPTPGPHRASNSGLTSPWGAQLPPGVSPHPLTQPTAYRARARGTEEPAASCAPQPLAPARHSRVRAPRARRPRTPQGRREPPMSPGSQTSRQGTSGRPVPHPGSKLRA
ncbi:hypothetical protein NDU88_002328 [Pleurodeles waltl]|uniref:Uncharacterized protein n=1 Tax=Pleurodeles waltl TaxID=8319 RepID=A0AAV7WRC0_PLEWA|nr:hypothetical protein NDU88_002328 [Pleurodeles waltl]